MRQIRIGCNLVNNGHSDWFNVVIDLEHTLQNAIAYYKGYTKLDKVELYNLIIYEFGYKDN